MMIKKILTYRLLWISFVIAVFNFAVGCQNAEVTENIAQQTKSSPSVQTYSLTPIADPEQPPSSYKKIDSFIGTYHRADGNRVLEGSGGAQTTFLDIRLKGKPVWVLAAAQKHMAVWYVVLQDGAVQAFQLNGEEVSEITPVVPTLPAGMPAVLVTTANGLQLHAPPADASPLTHPVFLNDGTQVFIDSDFKLRVTSARGTFLVDIDCLPDARILVDEHDRTLLLTDPTARYPHGVLGDDLEAGSFTLLDLGSETYQARKISVKGGEVIEGIAPIWTDLNGDGSREIIVTRSNALEGARIVVYWEDGSILAESEPIGTGFRWTHQLAAAQFIAGGSLEIAAIKTPHIGGVVEIFRLNGRSMELAASLSGYSSHVIGEKNLDQALAADFNGDGIIELAVPSQAQLEIAGIQYTSGVLAPVWELPTGEKLSTNLAGVRLDDGQMMLGAGTEGRVLRIWVFGGAF